MASSSTVPSRLPWTERHRHRDARHPPPTRASPARAPTRATAPAAWTSARARRDSSTPAPAAPSARTCSWTSAAATPTRTTTTPTWCATTTRTPRDTAGSSAPASTAARCTVATRPPAPRPPTLDACGGHEGPVPAHVDWGIPANTSVYHYHAQTKPLTSWDATARSRRARRRRCTRAPRGSWRRRQSVALSAAYSVDYDLWCPCYDSDYAVPSVSDELVAASAGDAAASSATQAQGAARRLAAAFVVGGDWPETAGAFAREDASVAALASCRVPCLIFRVARPRVSRARRRRRLDSLRTLPREKPPRPGERLRSRSRRSAQYDLAKMHTSFAGAPVIRHTCGPSGCSNGKHEWWLPSLP